MTEKQMKRLTSHCDKYFLQQSVRVIHPIATEDLHVDISLYITTKLHPYWKLVTAGASDYKMPPDSNTIARRNEYIMLVHKDIDMADEDVLNWYCQKLWFVARYPYVNKTHITYGHSFEWKNEDDNDEMIGAYIELPQTFDYGILHHKAGLFTDVAFLLVVLLNKQDLDLLKKIGPQQFSEFLFPEDDNAPPHFLSEMKRSEKF